MYAELLDAKGNVLLVSKTDDDTVKFKRVSKFMKFKKIIKKIIKS